MKKRRMLIAVFAGALLVSGLPGCRQSGGDNVAARFKGGSLTVEDLDAHRRILSRQAPYRDNPERLTPELVFEHAVNMEMIIAKGLKEKLHLDPRIRAQIHGFMSDLFLKILQDKLVPEIDREQFTDEEVRAYFDEHIDSYRIPALYGVRIIRHADPEVLKDLRRKIEAGQETFEAAALEYSTDAQTREKGGYTGKRALKRYGPEWRTVIETLAVDDISAPVKIKDSHYLFQVVEKTEPQQPAFEEKKAYVRNDLLYARYREAWRQSYDRLKEEFDLDVEDHVLQQFIIGEDRHESQPS
jgi:hypothetical protein